METTETSSNTLGGEIGREIKEGLREGLEAQIKVLHGLREEIRLQMHLASLEAKSKWQELEPQVERLETMAQNAGDSARALGSDLVESFRKFRDALNHA